MNQENDIRILSELTQIKFLWLSQDLNIQIPTQKALAAMQRVREEGATLRAEVERLKNEKDILERNLNDRTEELESAFVLHRSIEWKLNEANKRISELQKPVVIYGEPLRSTTTKGGDDGKLV